MAAPDPYANNPIQQFTTADWREVIANYTPSGGDNFNGDGGGDATISGTLVPFNKLQSFARTWLGWQGCSLTGGTGGVILQRTLPLRHPYYADLIADYVCSHPFRPDSSPSIMSRFAGLKRYISNAAAVPTMPFFSGYRWAKADIGFHDLPYDLVSDDDMASDANQWSQSSDSSYGTPGYQFPAEWMRFTELEPAPKTEALALDGFTMIYADGTGNTAPTTNPKGQSTPAPVGQLLVKADLALTTYKLPQEFLFGPITQNSPTSPQEVLPRNILLGLGKVNRYAIFGQPAGTLLFNGVELTRRRFSLRVPDGFTTFNETKYLWKARFLFSFFNPPVGINSNTTPSTFQGHNCLFWLGARGNDGNPVSGDKNSMKWFFATASGNPTDPGLLPTFDHGQLWRPVSNTAGVYNPCYDVGSNQHIPF